MVGGGGERVDARVGIFKNNFVLPKLKILKFFGPESRASK